MCHANEVVLPADTRQNLATGQRIRRGITKQADLQATIDKPGTEPLRGVQPFVAIELVDRIDAGHADQFTFFARHLGQRAVEITRTEEKAAMHERAAL